MYYSELESRELPLLPLCKREAYEPRSPYTIFTKGNAIPYQIVCMHQQFGGAPPGGRITLVCCRDRTDILNTYKPIGALQFELDVSHFNQGIYFLRVNGDGFSDVEKIIVAH